MHLTQWCILIFWIEHYTVEMSDQNSVTMFQSTDLWININSFMLFEPPVNNELTMRISHVTRHSVAGNSVYNIFTDVCAILSKNVHAFIGECLWLYLWSYSSVYMCVWNRFCTKIIMILWANSVRILKEKKKDEKNRKNQTTKEKICFYMWSDVNGYT